MRLYAESSAILAWLFDEAMAQPIEELLDISELVATSELTLVEVERVIVRATAEDRLDQANSKTAHDRLHEAARYWILYRLDERILDRAGRRFPVEPVRTLDAIHLASALEAYDAIPNLAVLTLDKRIRQNSIALGLNVFPAS